MDWTTIPPRAPHFGGIWEAGIKSAKSHLRLIVGSVPQTFEELSTTFCGIEAILNSRPLIDAAEHPADDLVLTPGHFLIGGPLNALPERTHGDKLPLIRWKMIECLKQQFWRRWHREYLLQLQKRVKWNGKKISVSVGDLAFIMDDNVPPLEWPLGRIEAVKPGADGVVRVVSLKTQRGIITRPVVKLRLLPSNNAEPTGVQGGRDVHVEIGNRKPLLRGAQEGQRQSDRRSSPTLG